MHDDLCPCINKGDKRWCECDLIAKVRADEREDASHRTAAALYHSRLADLRAKVEALPARGVVYPYDLDSLVPEALLYRADVLALLGGSDD